MDTVAHVCNPDTLATIQLLQKECKRCPKCAIPIFKIDGCDQMWCVQCHTAFNWRTGKVETGRVHNPHYFQYLREHAPDQLAADARAVGGAGAGECLDLHNDRTWSGPAERRLSSFGPNASSPYRHVMETLTKRLAKWVSRIRDSHGVMDGRSLSYMFRMLVSTPDHISYALLDRLPQQNNHRTNQDLRIKYLMKQIDEDEFRASLLRRQKTQSKQLEYREIVETFVQLFRENNHKLSLQILSTNDDNIQNVFDMYLKEMQAVESFTNTAITRLNTLHGGRKMRHIGEPENARGDHMGL
jgi:uncharacterized Zn finger protein (UPF0148 family)